MNSAAVAGCHYCTNPPDKAIESEMQFSISALSPLLPEELT
jgi:hypothetical protein